MKLGLGLGWRLGLELGVLGIKAETWCQGWILSGSLRKAMIAFDSNFFVDHSKTPEKIPLQIKMKLELGLALGLRSPWN